MHEVDFYAVGQAGRHGEAIAMRFTPLGERASAVVVIDAGFQENGEAFAEHIATYFGTKVDIALLTHPDGDHIGGMGAVLRRLDVANLLVHRLGDRGGASLPAAGAVDELIELAEARGTVIYEPFAGLSAFDGAFQILGPTEAYYDELVEAQVAEASERGRKSATATITATLRRLGQRFLDALPLEEAPFDDGGGTNPRNNSSAITLIDLGDHRMLFPADAGVPALDRALDWSEANGANATAADFVQLQHHGSRHNASSALLDRMLRPVGSQAVGSACVNVAPEAEKHPSPRVANGFMRRGYRVYQTRGQTIHHHSQDAPPRPDWVTASPIEPLDETEEE